MKKTIEIKHQKDHMGDLACDGLCYFMHESKAVMSWCKIDCMQDGETQPSDKCPGPGKYRMTLERVEEMKCDGCDHINYGVPLDLIDKNEPDYMGKYVIKCEKCFKYIRFPGGLKDE